MTKPRPLLRDRDYLGWWTGNTISALGTSVSTIAFPLLILYATGSVTKAGVISAASLIGTAATTLWGGAIADRVSRKAIMITGPIVQGAALGTVAVLVRTGHVSIAVLAGLACLSGMASGFAAGAQAPALRRLVSKEQMAAAASQMQGRDMAAELVGAPLGGLLFSVARWLPFGADAVSFLFASLGAAMIRRSLGPERDAGTEKTTVLADVRAGFSFVRGQPFLRFTAIFGSLFNVVGVALSLVFIALIKYRGGGPTEVGLVSSVALIGGIAGAVAAPLVLQRFRARLVLRVAMWMFAAMFALIAIVPKPWEIGLVLLLGMTAVAPINVALEAYVIRLVPDALLGRVSGVSRFGATSLQFLGPLLAGVLADAFGPPGGAFGLALLTIPFAVALYLTSSLDVLNQPVADVTELTLSA